MKFLCPGCDRLVELAAFRIDAGALVLRCPRCGEESRAESAEPSRPAEPAPPAPRAPLPSGPNVVPLRPGTLEGARLAAEAAASADPFKVPDGRCPKCVAPRLPDAAACPGCGLTFALFDPESSRPPAWLAEAWVALLSRWDQAFLHDDLLHQAMARADLAAVGRLYRMRLALAPDDPIAQYGRDEVVRLATAGGAAAVHLSTGGQGDGAPAKVTAAAAALGPWAVGGLAVAAIIALGFVISLFRQLLAQ